MFWRRRKIALPEGVASCAYCGGYHIHVCPYIEQIEYFETGRIRTIRFRAEHKSLISDIVYAE